MTRYQRYAAIVGAGDIRHVRTAHHKRSVLLVKRAVPRRQCPRHAAEKPSKHAAMMAFTRIEYHARRARSLSRTMRDSRSILTAPISCGDRTDAFSAADVIETVFQSASMRRHDFAAHALMAVAVRPWHSDSGNLAFRAACGNCAAPFISMHPCSEARHAGGHNGIGRKWKRQSHGVMGNAGQQTDALPSAEVK